MGKRQFVEVLEIKNENSQGLFACRTWTKEPCRNYIDRSKRVEVSRSSFGEKNCTWSVVDFDYGGYFNCTNVFPKVDADEASISVCMVAS